MNAAARSDLPEPVEDTTASSPAASNPLRRRPRARRVRMLSDFLPALSPFRPPQWSLTAPLIGTLRIIPMSYGQSLQLGFVVVASNVVANTLVCQWPPTWLRPKRFAGLLLIDGIGSVLAARLGAIYRSPTRVFASLNCILLSDNEKGNSAFVGGPRRWREIWTHPLPRPGSMRKGRKTPSRTGKRVVT